MTLTYIIYPPFVHAQYGVRYLLMLRDFGGHVERGALVVVGHVGVSGVQQLTQPKVCKDS